MSQVCHIAIEFLSYCNQFLWSDVTSVLDPDCQTEACSFLGPCNPCNESKDAFNSTLLLNSKLAPPSAFVLDVPPSLFFSPTECLSNFTVCPPHPGLSSFLVTMMYKFDV
jgi:hypothetical protein